MALTSSGDAFGSPDLPLRCRKSLRKLATRSERITLKHAATLGWWPPFPAGGLEVEVLQRKNCYIFGSLLRRSSNGYKPKTPLFLNAWGR